MGFQKEKNHILLTFFSFSCFLLLLFLYIIAYFTIAHILCWMQWQKHIDKQPPIHFNDIFFSVFGCLFFSVPTKVLLSSATFYFIFFFADNCLMWNINLFSVSNAIQRVPLLGQPFYYLIFGKNQIQNHDWTTISIDSRFSHE